MRRVTKQILKDIQRGENIDLIATFGLVIVISILNGFGFASATLVSSITLATLGLIAVGLLVTRYRLDDIYRKENATNAVQFHAHRLEVLEADIAAAKEIWMMGLTLRGTTTRNYHIFKNKAEKGYRLRTLVVDLEKVEMEPIIRRFSRGGHIEQFQADFHQALNQYKQIRQLAKNPEYIQVRLLDFAPPYSVYIFPKLDGGGVVYVEMYGYKSPMGAIPKFRITEREAPEWYKHFSDQFEAIWDGAAKTEL
ncbi:MAG: hypothetical protein ACT4QE_02795 [Anaerolineales bacterium]